MEWIEKDINSMDQSSIQSIKNDFRRFNIVLQPSIQNGSLTNDVLPLEIESNIKYPSHENKSSASRL